MMTIGKLKSRSVDNGCWWCPKPEVDVIVVRDDEGRSAFACLSCEKPAYRKLKANEERDLG